MHIGLIIEKLLFDRKVKKINLYNYLGIAKNTLNDYLVGKTSMTVEMLQKVADFFKVPISYFFEDTPNGNITQKGKGNFIANSHNVQISECESRLEVAENKITNREALLVEKERTIQILMDKK